MSPLSFRMRDGTNHVLSAPKHGQYLQGHPIAKLTASTMTDRD